MLSSNAKTKRKMVKKSQLSASIGLGFVLVVAAISPLLSKPSYAAQITSRSLTLQAGSTDGGSKPSGVVNHLFAFTVPSVGDTNIGSIKFQYCKLAAGTCDMPTGL